jgi:hypothetical protein
MIVILKSEIYEENCSRECTDILGRSSKRTVCTAGRSEALYFTLALWRHGVDQLILSPLCGQEDK